MRERDPGSVPTSPNNLISAIRECLWGPEEERAIRFGGFRGRLIRSAGSGSSNKGRGTGPCRLRSPVPRLPSDC